MPRHVGYLFLSALVLVVPIAAAQDVTAPVVTHTAPVAGDTDVTTSLVAVFVHFDEQMDRDTYAGNVYLTVGTAAGGTRVAIGTLHAGGTYCGLALAETLEQETIYGVHVTTGVADLAGNVLAAPYTGTFTTASAANEDTDPPFVAQTTPLAGAVGVPVDMGAVIVTFNEGMDATSLTGAVSLRVGLTPDGPAVSLAGQSVDGGDCTLTPTELLAAGTVHSIHVTTAATDLAGNPLPTGFSCSFRTATAGPDLAAPFVTSTDPGDGATGIHQDIASVRIDFNELMDIDTYEGNIALSGPGAGVAGLVVGVSHVTVLLSGALATTTEYTLEVGSGVRDVAGNGLTTPHTARFTTSNQVPGERMSWGGLKASFR
ncbi:MAG: Ig-like domain-containing protein [bacterium]|nr:Ig-like domain-containing protein [bacterium]